MNPRYLINFDLAKMNSVKTGMIVIGSGSAGLTAALHASAFGNVTIVTKSKIEESNTLHAQGGVAVSLSKDDSWEKHFEDTIFAGAGLCNRKSVEILVKEGVDRVNELIDLGANFDRHNGKLLFTREAAHGQRRIIHANGDNTGAEIERTLVRAVKNNRKIDVMEEHYAIDLLHHKNRCYGVIAFNRRTGRKTAVIAPSTILATGGAGQVYRETTNPEVATADGMAIAYRAGTALMDMEFMQFHPTTLYLAGAPRFLISETVRGEGGVLVDKNGYRFMPDYHPLCELAPRDVVSRAIVEQMKKTDSNFVSLDLSNIPPAKVGKRFPNIKKICNDYGLKIPRDKIPVRPSAHYMMGGVRINLGCETNVKGLYACGEVSCSGVHGANRLASNSLLESMVFGYRAGIAAGQNSKMKGFRVPPIKYEIDRKILRALDVADVKRSLQSVMWRCVGLEREEHSLAEAYNIITFWERYILSAMVRYADGFELQNMLMVAKLMAKAALRRKESRGAHYRTDFPKPVEKWKKHINFSLKY
ncbi:L-aspartate oxidase [bacterium]|jgi:L-aspartate oxidase|nr:L-aspartate oxidase [bacterium]